MANPQPIEYKTITVANTLDVNTCKRELCVFFEGSTTPLKEYLNAIGLDGWIVSISTPILDADYSPTGSFTFLLYRPIPEEGFKEC
jgi:hypothetical protein